MANPDVSLPVWGILHMDKRRYFYSLLVVLLLIAVVAGWFATDYPGKRARQEVIAKSRGNGLALSIYASSTFNHFEATVKSLAGAVLMAPALMSGQDRDMNLWPRRIH